AYEIGFLKTFGHISVTKTATAMAKGTAITNAIREETTVPKIKGKAPNEPETGSHSLAKKKWMPNLCQASAERCINSARINPTMPSTTKAASITRPLKAESKLMNDLLQAEAARVGFTRVILEDSGEAIFFRAGPKACPADALS